MIVRSLFAAPAVLGLVCLAGCAADNGGAPRSPTTFNGAHPTPAAEQANYHAPSDLSASDAVPQGTSGNNVYDQPGELPPNSGGTNAGRAGIDAAH